MSESKDNQCTFSLENTKTIKGEEEEEEGKFDMCFDLLLKSENEKKTLQKLTTTLIAFRV